MSVSNEEEIRSGYSVKKTVRRSVFELNHEGVGEMEREREREECKDKRQWEPVLFLRDGTQKENQSHVPKATIGRYGYR